MNRIQFRAPNRPPTIEFDHSVGAWYVRFRSGKVKRTISEEKPGVVAAIDLDANNQVVGIELIGVKEFSISLLRKIAPMDTSKVDFDRARFVRAGTQDMVGA